MYNDTSTENKGCRVNERGRDKSLCEFTTLLQFLKLNKKRTDVRIKKGSMQNEETKKEHKQR